MFALAAALAALAQAPACASEWTHADGRLRSTQDGASILDPAGQGDWTPVDVEGAALAYRHADGASLSWIRQCGRGARDPRLSARLLLLGLDLEGQPSETPLEVAGAAAWSLRAEARRNGQRVELIAVTRVAAGCSDDWVLVGTDANVRHGAFFSRWWQSFVPGPAK